VRPPARIKLVNSAAKHRRGPAAPRTLTQPDSTPAGRSPYQVEIRGYFPVHFIPAYNLPVYASQRPLPDATQELGSRLLARLCRGRHRRRQTSTRLQGATRTDLAQFIRSCFIGRISYLTPTSSRIIGSAAVRRSTSVWSFAEKIDSPHSPLGSSIGRDTRSNQLRPGSEGSRREPS
jgi:hypothetical protein